MMLKGFCAKVSLKDHVRLDELHTNFKIVSLKERRRIQLILLMCKESKYVKTHKVFPKDARISRRIVFRTDTYEV